MPKVTIAIPTYNRQSFLQECLASILAQTYQDIDIWVFDNNSSYDVRALIEGFADRRIRLLTSPVNLGNQGNLKRIFQTEFPSDYVLVFHDDDAMHPRMLEREMTIMQIHPDLIWAGSSLKFCRNGKEIKNFKLIEKKIEPMFCGKAELVRLFMNNFHLAFDSVLYRKVFLKTISEYFDSFGKWADRPYLIGLADNGQAAVLPEPLVNYRIHSTQDSRALLLYKKDFSCLKELFIFYRASLPQPLALSDRKLFYRFSTVNLIRSMPSFVRGFKPAWDYLRSCRRDNLLDFGCVDLKGWIIIVVYFFKIVTINLFPKQG